METSGTAKSAANAATRSLVTALGAGSGIDMMALAENLAAAQFAARTDRLAAKSETLERQISAASTLKSMMLSLSTSLGNRIRVGDLSPQPQVANAAVASGSLTGAIPPRGTYTLEVTALARGQTLASPAYAAATDTVGSGTLTLRFGTVASGGADGGFTADAARAQVDIAIPAGATLTDVASAINGANAGVSAYVAQTVDGAQLVLKGANGAANGFVLEASEDSGAPGLANLAWSPSGDADRLLSTASNAAFKVDGLSMTSASNTVSDAIPGVRLDLTGTNVGAPTTISFSDPSAAITQAMQDLTDALNEIAGELSTLIDPKSGDLARDGGARALRRQLSELAGTIVIPNAPDGTPSTLADLGLSTQRDGSFALDQKRLGETLAAHPAGAAAMFTTGLYGVYATIDKISRSSSVASDPGTLAGSISRYTKQQAEITENQAEIAERQEALRAQLASRFVASESRVGASRSTLTFLQNQIAAWNGQRT